ncbi:hypothetical protein F0U61_48680 [Archangium violaceum]|uniref:hypothetical protein n=1 Tax=Archangium violaceum TaxID=83451 RepID=UPI002B307B2F|nr:hypothetical protein F0U61_48680 [Archangium violaceum]
MKPTRISSLMQAVLACALLVWSVTPAQAATALVTHGRYQYGYAFDTAYRTEEQRRLLEKLPIAGSPIEFEQGALTDGDATTGGRVAWTGKSGAPTRVTVVFDLLQDLPLDRVEVVAQGPNSYWSVQEMELHDREAGSDVFRSAGQQFWQSGKTVVFSLGGRKARFLRLQLKRAHSFVHLPLSEVRIHTTGAVSTSGGTPADLTPELTREAQLVDRYGQFLYEEWPGKISSDAQLVADAAAEAQRLAQPPASTSPSGTIGSPPAPRYASTGFFRLEKINQRWWLITPEGDPFFVIGIDGAKFLDGGYATPVLNSEGSRRKAFKELPDPTQFSGAYTTLDGKRYVNFVTANLQRKYGADYNAQWARMMDKRLRAWGFNTHAKWTRDDRIAFPFISVLRPSSSETRSILWAPDPFDPGWELAVENGVKGNLATLRDNPRVIGHTFENERGWDRSVVEAALKLGSGSAAKKAFIDFMLARNGGQTAVVARKLGLPETTTVDGLVAKPVTHYSQLGSDISDFLRLASRRYHEVVRRVLKRLDPNHLYLGGSLVPTWRNSPEWIEGSVEFVDALSFDVYQKDPSWISQYLSHDKPILLLEFSFSVVGRGLTAHSLASAVPHQRSRGLHYRYFVEQLASKPQFIGFGFFLLYDQAVTHRSLPDGEKFNMGLINQADQPYEEMLEEVKKTHQRLYDIHRGVLAPVGAEILSGGSAAGAP